MYLVCMHVCVVCVCVLVWMHAHLGTFVEVREPLSGVRFLHSTMGSRNHELPALRDR